MLIMKSNTLIYLLYLLIPIVLQACQTPDASKVTRPNIVLIFIDDFGWPGISSYGNEHVPTPHIDELAVKGMKFTDAYVTPQCTPTRASLLTGQHTARLVKKYLDKGYPEEGQNNATYLAAIEHLDNSVGRLLAEMKTLGLEENTVVLFYTDNGGVERFFSNAPLRAGKGSAYEGGIRVPLLARWPGKIPEGAVSDLPVHVTDLYPTFLELAGIEKPAGLSLDGLSIAPELHGEKMSRDRDLFWYMPLYDYQWGATPAAVIRSGRYKLIKSFGDYYDHHTDSYTPEGRVELYDLQNDIGEENDLSAAEPERTHQLEKKLLDWIVQDMQAPLPEENPDYDRDRIFERSNDFNFPLFFEYRLPDIHVKTGEAIRYVIPRAAVGDYDAEGYNLQVTTDDGREWPAWLVYNSIDRALLGTPAEAGQWGDQTDGRRSPRSRSDTGNQTYCRS